MYRLKKTFYEQGCTIVIPTWNSAATIKRCIESIPNAFPDDVPLEVLIIDKPGYDATWEIVQRCFSTNRLKIIPHRLLICKGTIGEARLTGIENALYGTIFWLDSDIVLPADYIESLFYYVYLCTIKGQIGLDSLEKTFGIQGHMVSGEVGEEKIIYRWWSGQDLKNFELWGCTSGGATANLLIMNDFKRLTKDDKKQLCKLRSQEDNFLSTKIKEWGYKIYMFNVGTKHLIYESTDKGSNLHYKILWQLPGYREIVKSRWVFMAKLRTLWWMKWIWARGFNSYRYYHDIRLLLYSLKIQLLILRVFIKDKRIVTQARLESIRDW